jgi:hypothetical protein
MNSPKILRAQRAIRRMRGETQSYLIAADDRKFYVVKFANNPQFGRRVLVNELIASHLFGHLGICTPQPCLIEIDQSFITNNPQVKMNAYGQSNPPTCGLHFGSTYPGNPSRHQVFDCVPDSYLSSVYNIRDFLGALVADKWLSNADGRQTIYFRAKHRKPGPDRVTWVVQMIDNGYIFDGPNWDFRVSPPRGLYTRLPVYGPDPILQDFYPWIDRVNGIGLQMLSEIQSQIPAEWIQGDESKLELLLAKLRRRTDLLPGLIEESLRWLRQKKFNQKAREGGKKERRPGDLPVKRGGLYVVAEENDHAGEPRLGVRPAEWQLQPPAKIDRQELLHRIRHIPTPLSGVQQLATKKSRCSGSLLESFEAL